PAGTPPPGQPARRGRPYPGRAPPAGSRRPEQLDELDHESRTERCGKSATARRREARPEILEDEEDRCGRRVADAAHDPARGRDVTLIETEAAHDGVDDRLASGMKRKHVEVGCSTDEAVDEGWQVRLEEAGELARHDHPEPVISALIPERLGARGHQLVVRPADLDAPFALATTKDGRTGAIA